jgi:hypothetical protein
VIQLDLAQKETRSSMEIGRRELLTGLAAVAVAGSVPALQAITASVASLGRMYTYGDTDTLELYDAAREVLFRSLWHIDLTDYDTGTFRHVATGLTFITDHDRPAILYRVRQIETGATVDTAAARIIGVAAFHLCSFAALAGSFRQQFGENGAFFMHHDDDPDSFHPWRRMLTDAPPLPRVAI